MHISALAYSGAIPEQYHKSDRLPAIGTQDSGGYSLNSNSDNCSKLCKKCEKDCLFSLATFEVTMCGLPNRSWCAMRALPANLTCACLLEYSSIGPRFVESLQYFRYLLPSLHIKAHLNWANPPCGTGLSTRE